MNISQMYVALAIVVLVVIALLIFLVSKNSKQTRLSPLPSLAFGFILAGILSSDNELIGYGLIGVGVLLAVVDILRNRSRTI